MSRAVGLVLPVNDEESTEVLDWLPVEAESWGFDSLWLTDHVVGVRAMEGVYTSYWLETLTTLAWLASRTSTVRLGTGILVVPYRDPVLTAKALVTLDHLSKGRIDFGVGAGWSRAEFRAVGVEQQFDRRGAATDEALTVIRRCWEGGVVDHEGEFFRVRNVEFHPTPTQPDGIPIWVGGNSAAARRRAVRHGDVWHPHELSVDELKEAGDQLDALAGRSIPRSLRLIVTEDDVAGLADKVDEYAEAGCSRVVIDFRSVPSRRAAELSELAGAVLFG